VEANPDAAGPARAHLDLVIQGSVLDCELPFSDSEFDYIVFADVLEHVPDPDAALDRCLPLLAARGSVIVSVPNMRFYLVLLRLLADRWGYTDHGIRDRTHLRIFTRRSLIRMLESHGLEIQRLTRNYRLVEDQTHIGRVGAVTTRIFRRCIAPFVMRDLFAFQYVVLASRKS
jgi:2-polyprenyl-3-methyl-5-hydroxy-6-metoxy-1,4-benzoquinol methylase